MIRTYSFPILLVSLLFVAISLSALNTQTPLWLVDANVAMWQIGMVGTSYFIGNLVGTLIANWFISKINVKQTYTCVCLLFAFATLGMGLSVNVVCWSFFRFLIGIACAVTWIIVESSILLTSKANNRSKMIAIYMTTYYLGSVLGLKLLHYFPKSILYFALVIVVLMALAILFILFTHYHLPSRKTRVFNILPMIKFQPARLGLVGCIISGMVIGAIYSLLPAYYSQLGFTDDEVSNWIILVIASGLIAQMPIGFFANKYGTSSVLIVESLLFTVACFMIINNYWLIFATIVVGATIFTVYPLSMSWACSTVDKSNIVLMNQTMLLVNTIGCLIAPAIISLFMDKWGNNFLFICFMGIAIYFMILLMVKRNNHSQFSVHSK